VGNRKNRKLALLGALGLIALIFSGTTLAAVGASSEGHGTLSTTSGKRQFSFSARTYSDATVKGQATLINPEFTGANGKSPYQLQLDISCMKVVGNIAIFGGTTKRTNDPSLVDAAFFSVQDNGEPGKNDKISRVFFWDDDPNTVGDPQACQAVQPTDFPLETIEAGNIQVKGS
jgi:hypothetical protein